MSVRTLLVWCQDWPVVAAGAAAGLPPQHPAAVLAASRILACSATARANGVRRAMQRRQAQSRCPDLTLFPDDPARDARLFEPVAAAVEELAVGVEVVRPGIVAVPVRGPAGYFGGEEVAAERLVDHISARAGVECQIGIADGLFAATLAARRGAHVEPGGSPAFLSPLDVRDLGEDHEELTHLLRRLGLTTLGAFGALAEHDVASRFGADAVHAHRLARGLQERPPARRRPPADLVITEELDPPVDRVDAAAFVARTLAERLHTVLAAHGLACTRLAISAVTEHAEELHRVWRCAQPLTPNGIADRVRWQLDGWLRGKGARPSAGIRVLRIEPEETVDGRILQLGLWQGGYEEADERAGRALVRVQGLLGPEGAYTAVLGGGRGPGDRVRLVPWGNERAPAADPTPPWPGRVPEPSPATVWPEPLPATVLDESGIDVSVSGGGLLSAAPCEVAVDGGRLRPIACWAGPWPADEHWWDGAARRRARMQVVLEDRSDKSEQDALLLVREHGGWAVEGSYD